VREGDVYRYHGIPYAAPPVGALRWKAPQPPATWTGVRDGSLGGHPCVQTGGLALSSSEDCLYLSVARPARQTAAMPVILWVHGGAFIGGSGEGIDPSAFAAGGPAVVVTVNYRLGPFGYLALPELAAESGGDAGNYATQDLIAALRWVRENAAVFGGDPKNVTIAGESAGSINVCALLAAPSAHGLVQRAIMESGPCTWPLPTMQAAEQTGTALADRLGCADPATAATCLRMRSAADVLTAGGGSGEIFSPFPYSPAVGGRTLPTTVAQAVWSGALSPVPMLIGTVKDEGRPFTAYWANAGPINDLGVDGVIRGHFPDRAERILAAYPAGQVTPRERLAQIITDSMFTCPTARTAQMFAGIVQAPVYTYEFDTPEQAPVTSDVSSGATHGWELGFLFPADATARGTTAQKALSAAMIGYWTRFAATGDPNAGSRTGPSAAPAASTTPGSAESAGSTTPGSAGPAGPAESAGWPRFDTRALRTGTDWIGLRPGAVGPTSGIWSAHHCDAWN
jgi:para-nitrobenzyl esterase